MRTISLLAPACALIACMVWLQEEPLSSAPLQESAVPVVSLDTEPGSERQPYPAGALDGCEAGCSIENHPIEHLTETEYLEFVKTFANGDVEAGANALETLLFHAPHVREFMRNSGTPWLSDDQTKFLRRELSRTHVRLWLRIVDQSGIVRASLDGELFPINQKTHLQMTETQDLPAPEVSGTVYRTGLHHLWTRI